MRCFLATSDVQAHKYMDEALLEDLLNPPHTSMVLTPPYLFKAPSKLGRVRMISVREPVHGLGRQLGPPVVRTPSSESALHRAACLEKRHAAYWRLFNSAYKTTHVAAQNTALKTMLHVITRAVVLSSEDRIGEIAREFRKLREMQPQPGGRIAAHGARAQHGRRDSARVELLLAIYHEMISSFRHCIVCWFGLACVHSDW
ncbi:hypothetical protein Gpo141_00014048 [Globisporangium polare]